MGICVSCRRRERKAPEKHWVPGAGGSTKGAVPEFLRAMANSISNIKMTNPIKGIVSKRRKRYVKDGFNLDLAYITDRLIAMGFPAEKLEAVYRNHIDEVYRFLEQKHKDHYMIYNLCAERDYDYSKFNKRVQVFAFKDHEPPLIGQIQPFCEDVHNWLSKDPRNVAAVHCKAGKGRTGTMVCCYLLYSGQKTTADEALKYYAKKRTHDEKGVTIPSQRRYVEYYAALVRGGLSYRPTRVHVAELLMYPPPAFNGSQCTLQLTVTQADPLHKTSLGRHEVRRHSLVARVAAEACAPLAGDVRVDVYCKPKMKMRKERLFHFWFNTYFVTACVGASPVPAPHDNQNQETFKLTLDKWQLDDAHKDKQHKLYSADFKVELIVHKLPDSSKYSVPRGASPAASSDDTEQDWDSGERGRDEEGEGDGEGPPYAPLRGDATSDGEGERPDADDDSKSTDHNNYSDRLLRVDAPDDYSDDEHVERRAPYHHHHHSHRHHHRELAEFPLGGVVFDDSDDFNEPLPAYPPPPPGGAQEYSPDMFPETLEYADAHDYPTDLAKDYDKNKKCKDAAAKPRLSLGDMRASWREFSGKFGENRKKKHRDD